MSSVFTLSVESVILIRNLDIFVPASAHQPMKLSGGQAIDATLKQDDDTSRVPITQGTY